MSQSTFKERINYGWQLGQTGYTLIRQHKNILLFSLLSGILLLLASGLCGILILPYLRQTNEQPLTQHAKIIIGTLSFFYVMLLAFISSFMNVALSFYTAALLEQKPVSFSESISRAFSRFFTILAWSFFAAIIGTAARALQSNNSSKSTGSRITLGLLGSMAKLAWAVLTYFVTPLIALENTNIMATIKKSDTLMSKTWGETVGAQFFIGFYTLLYLFGFYVLFFTPFYLTIRFFGPFKPALALAYLSFGFCAFFIPFILFLIMNTTINTIVKTALYHHAIGKPTGTFPSNLLKQAFAQTDKL